MLQILKDSTWVAGLDSFTDPAQLPQGVYQWGQNIINRGGVIQTRQGFAQIASVLNQRPKGLALFQTTSNTVYLVAAIGDTVYKTPYPFTAALTAIPGIALSNTRNIQFESAVQAQYTDDTGIHQLPVPRKVLIIQDGIHSPWYWDGTSAGVVSGIRYNNTNIINPMPIGSFMKWAGDRLWLAKGNRLRASDLLNPFQFVEETQEATGGFFFLPANITGMGLTHDFKSLLAMTDQTTSALQVGIENRDLWPETQDFQRVIFPTIGLTSNRTIVNQYGITWWVTHDGLIGLDSALQAYQSSHIHIRDQNMARSKSGIKSWMQDGGQAGCGGSYGNFLFISVPSGSKYNVHTWVMDGGPVDTINQEAPPIWCSNWTGIRPEQWVTGVINGLQRCFCISDDLVPEGRQSTIWEAFIGQREDAPRPNTSYVPKDIACAFETRFYSLDQYARFRWVELDLSEIDGKVNLQVYYCGRRTSYKKILDKKLNAKVTPSTDQVFEPDTIISALVPQSRIVRSISDSHDLDDLDSGVQTQYIRSRDREFSILVTWTGKMAITGLRVAVDPEGDNTEGFCEEDELLIREIDAGGAGSISNQTAQPNIVNLARLTSQYMAPMTPRWTEFPSYDAATANGVFFVAEPEFSIDPGGYPSNTYPKSVIVSTETPGAHMRYTLDGTAPSESAHSSHGTLIDGISGTVSVAMNTTMKVKAFRTGLTESALAVGLYSQAVTMTPQFSLPAGGYHSTDFPLSITITSTFGATIKYTTDGTIPSRTHGSVYSTPVSLTHPKTLKAMAFLSNYLDSPVAVATYSQIPTVDIPTLNPDGGNFADYPVSVAIHTTTSGASLRYTTDGTDPTSDPAHGTVINSNSGTVHVVDGETLKVIATKADMDDSAIKSATYGHTTPTVTEPSFAPDGGEFNVHSVNVTVTCDTSGADIYYTLGSQTDPPPDPTTDNGTLIHSGDVILIDIGHKILKAVGIKEGWNDSTIHSADFDYQFS